MQYNIICYNLREYTYVPQGSGIVYITIPRDVCRGTTRIAPGRAEMSASTPISGSRAACMLRVPARSRLHAARTGVYRRSLACTRRIPAACTGAFRSVPVGDRRGMGRDSLGMAKDSQPRTHRASWVQGATSNSLYFN